MKKIIILLFAIFTLNIAYTQVCNDKIRLSITVNPSVMAFNGFTTEQEFITSYEDNVLDYLNQEFSAINIEFFATYNDYYFLEEQNPYTGQDDFEGDLNTIRIKYGTGGEGSSFTLCPFSNINHTNTIDPRWAVHEMGHQFGLRHTFATINGEELVVRPGNEVASTTYPANCDYAGDLFRDTPACSWVLSVDDNGDTYPPHDGNHMDYGSFWPYYFTQQQYERMRYIADNKGYYYDFINANNRYEFDELIDFSYVTGPDINSCYDQFEVTFTNNTVPSGWLELGVYNIEWDFGDGNTSTLENPTHTYAQAGTYTVTLNYSWVVASEIGCSFRKKNVILNPILTLPYSNDFESSDALNDFAIFNPPICDWQPRLLYHGFDNYVLGINHPETEISFCVDATSCASLLLSFDINSIGGFTHKTIKVFANGQLIESVNHPGSNYWITNYVDLTDFVGQVINIRLEAPPESISYEHLISLNHSLLSILPALPCSQVDSNFYASPVKSLPL